MKTTTKRIAKVQAAITAKRKAGFSYDDPELKALMAEMDKLTGWEG